MYISGSKVTMIVDLISKAVTTLPFVNWPALAFDGDSSYIYTAGSNVFAIFSLPKGELLTNGFFIVDDGQEGHIEQLFVTRDPDVNLDHLIMLESSRLVLMDVVRPQPQVSSALNAATGKPPVASGNWFTLFGRNLACEVATPSAAYESKNPNSPFPTDLGCAKIILAYNGKAIPLAYVSPNQINALVPGDAPVGAVTGTVEIPDADGTTASASFSVNVAEFAPGFYAQVGPTGVLSADANPVKTGDLVIVYAAGLGPTNPSVLTGQPAPPLASTIASSHVSVTLGGTQAKVQYSGLTPGAVGLYQVNYFIPSGLASGVHTVLLSVNGVSSPAAKVLVQ